MPTATLHSYLRTPFHFITSITTNKKASPVFFLGSDISVTLPFSRSFKIVATLPYPASGSLYLHLHHMDPCFCLSISLLSHGSLNIVVCAYPHVANILEKKRYEGNDLLSASVANILNFGDESSNVI